MSIKTYYTRFLFFFIFIICISIYLLFIKISNTDYIYNHIFRISKHPKEVQRNSWRKVLVKEVKKIFEVPFLKQTNENLPIYLKDNEKTIHQIIETCKENNLTTPLTKRNFLYSPNNSGLYCWIRKAGSTSFTKLFSEMNNRMVSHDYYREIDSLAPKSKMLLRHLIKDSRIFKLLVVRHPFERLVSAYRDRIEDNSKYTAQSWIFVPKIFHLTRPELFQSEGTVDTSLIKIFYEDKRLKLIPSFREFVKWFLHQDSTNDDPHWNQYYRHCSLCSVRYDFVLKLDNYTKNEINFIFSRMNLDRNKMYLSNLEETKQGRTSFDETCNYFKNLSHEAVVNLYEKYKIDFDMFNYEFDKYFECIEGD